MQLYDLIVIGGGPAGSNAVNYGLKKTDRVALIEQNHLGGTCLNVGCDPTKALLHAA